TKGNGLFHTFNSVTENSDSTFCFDPTLFALIAGAFS
ncbi:hypothetical protein CEXT_433971, partial [Caerostris extrusa]